MTEQPTNQLAVRLDALEKGRVTFALTPLYDVLNYELKVIVDDDPNSVITEVYNAKGEKIG